MSDFPLDEDLNSPPISPSPSNSIQLDVQMLTLNDFSLDDMTPTQLNFTWASGDIPVLLYDEDYARVDQEGKEFSISDFTIASVVNLRNSVRERNRHSSIVSVSPRSGINDVARPMSRVSVTDRPDSGLLGLQSLDSTNTISSVGTFGPGRKNHRNPNNDEVTPIPFPEVTLLDYARDRQEGAEECVFTGGSLKNGPSIPHNLAGIFANPSVLADLKRTSLVETDSSGCLGIHRQRRQSQTYVGPKSLAEADVSSVVILEESESGLESPSTPRKPNTKTISWISSRDWDCQQYKEYVARADLSFSPQSSTHGRRSSINAVDETEDLNSTPPNLRHRRSPIRSKALEHRDLNVILETPRASQFSREIYEYQADKSIPRETHHPSPVKSPGVPDEHRWLRDITVQFLIDQEGFRAAHPSFKFSGISRLRYRHNSKPSMIIMAQFRPITRQAFHFHYGPFESPPILRRVTVNLDETHDYLTKQALLTLKSNGVYVLHGHEMSIYPHATAAESSPESSKLYWQFEYMIDDRRVEASGRIMEGEKNLIPLTFSCSPGLLSPGQGKRNSIMHVFKKGLAMKLVSEKLQPPGISPAPSSKSSGNEASHPTPIQGDGAHIAHFFSAKAHAWNIHKRGQSHGVQNTSPSKVAFHQTQLRDVETSPAQHRRASSGWENQRPSSGLHFGTHSSSATTYPGSENRNVVSVPIPPFRHIMPPQKLSELLDSGSPPSNTGQSIASIHSNPFAPLTPRPRKTSYARGPSHSHTP